MCSIKWNNNALEIARQGGELYDKFVGFLEDLEKIEKKVKSTITECEEFAESSPFPDKSVMYDVVYEQKDYPFIKHKLS